MAGQFGYEEKTRYVCTSCGEAGNHAARHQGFIELPQPEAEQQPSMTDMLLQHFATSDPLTYRAHEGCTGEGDTAVTMARTERLILDEILPGRLAVKPAPGYRNIRGATDANITFTYTVLHAGQAEDGNPFNGAPVDRTATYRWLGGIYTMEHHCRVYWQDSDYGSSTREIRIYDGMKACGVIIGGFLPYTPAYRVPPEWASGAEILFYERLNEDNKYQVLEGVQDMIADLTKQPEVNKCATKKRKRSPKS